MIKWSGHIDEVIMDPSMEKEMEMDGRNGEAKGDGNAERDGQANGVGL